MPTKPFTKLSSIPELCNFVMASAMTLSPAVIEGAVELGKESFQALCGYIQSNAIAVNAGLSVGGALALYKLYCGRYVSEGNHEKNVEQLVEKLVEGLKQLANAQSELCRMAVASPAASTQGSALLQTTVEQNQVLQLQQFPEGEAPQINLLQKLVEKVESMDQVQQQRLGEMLSVFQNIQDQHQNQSAAVGSFPKERREFQEHVRIRNEKSTFTNVTNQGKDDFKTRIHANEASYGFTKTPSSYATPRSTAGSSQESVYDLENSDGNLTGNDESRTNSPFTQVTPKATKGENYSASVAIDLEPSSSREYRNEASKTTLGNETDVSRENDSPSLSGNLSVSSHSTSSRVGESPIQDDGKISSNDDKFRKSSSTSPATYASDSSSPKSSTSTVTSQAYASGSKSPKSSGGKRSDSKRKRNLSKNSPSKKSKPMGQPRRSGRANKGNPPKKHVLVHMTPEQKQIWNITRKAEIEKKNAKRKADKARLCLNPNDADTEAQS